MSDQQSNHSECRRAVTGRPSPSPRSHLASTHEVFNQPPPLEDFNLYTSDLALTQAVAQHGASWASSELTAFGELTGSAPYLELGFLANENRPTLDTHDRYGHRTDEVRFHPAWHELMRTALGNGLHSSPWQHPGPGAHVARTARCYMQTQVEAGHGCPITMTFASIPALQAQPNIAELWVPRILQTAYDPRNVPDTRKTAVTIGMAMTEKQGGSDVRANTTRAYPVAQPGPGQAYELVGHKWFVSAPMCDAFLVLAQTDKGLSCFLLPRWRPDGSKNPLQLQRLKTKMGNVSNASSETELRGALAWMVGEEGRGVSTIIEMVALTRFDCLMGSSAAMRMAVAQAIHHCNHRSAFGARLRDQPLMQNVLADLAIESEAALQLTMRLAAALDRPHEPAEQHLLRIATPLGKYWVCKRVSSVAVEAMECIGGSGVMENCMMPRLYRDAPVNAIWEGSGNVQCLDLMRILQKQPQALDAFRAECAAACGQNAVYDRYLKRLEADWQQVSTNVALARRTMDRMAIALQASLLIRHSDPAMAEAFCLNRCEYPGASHFGTLDCPSGSGSTRAFEVILDRCAPRLG